MTFDLLTHFLVGWKIYQCVFSFFILHNDFNKKISSFLMAKFTMSSLTCEQNHQSETSLGFVHYAIMPLCHFLDISFCRVGIVSLLHIYMSLHHYIMLSSCHYIFMSLCHFVIVSFCHYVTSMYHLVNFFISSFGQFVFFKFVYLKYENPDKILKKMEITAENISKLDHKIIL